uniref:Protein O-mannose kinase n=1 Tax=Cuerna arida TaxID=1464854 RepID=A0A1B6G1A5_9HEMI
MSLELSVEMEIVIITILLSGIQYIGSELVECPLNHFKLKGMESCHPWLDCEDLDSITVIKRLGTGAVKDVFLADWKGFLLALSIPVNPTFLEDFMAGVNVLKLLNSNKYVVQYIGYCNRTYALLTEYHAKGNAADFLSKISPYNVMKGLEFCHQYALILNHLHNGPAGKRVFCDSNSLDKLLSQLLVTSDEQLILNDVDALPEVVNVSGVKCGKQQLHGTFVAPEQLWNRNEPFSDNLMPSYNEKTDIWKAGTVCGHFLNKVTDGVWVRYRLYEFHSKCKNHEPLSRPNAEELVIEYSKVADEYMNHSDL